MAGNARILTVKILTDASGAGAGVRQAQATYGKFATAIGTKSQGAGVQVGNKLVSGIDKALGVGLKVVAGGAALIAGTALAKGFSRLNSIDQATAKLRGLGHSAAEVAKIMENSNAAVKGTAFGLDEAATTAAQVVASGIKPGKQLESVLSTVADSATIAGTSMDSMGSIFAKVAAKNKLQGDVINQLTDAGIPILQLLAKHYNTTAEAASEMVSKGKVDFAAFSAAMKEGVGGAALESGNTFQGAWANTMAALGRIGANLLSPLFTGAKNGLKGIPALLEPIEAKAAEVGQALAGMGTWVQKNATLLKVLGTVAAVTIGILLGFRAVIAVMTAYRAVLSVVRAAQIGYAAATYGSQAATYGAAAATTAQNIALLAGKAAYVAVAAAQKIAGAVTLAWNTATAALTASTLGQTVALVASKVAMVAVSAAQKVATIAQWAWNAAMSANPIGIVIIAVVALVAAIVLLWTQSEGFRNFFIGVWAAITAAAVATWNWIVSAARNAWNFMLSVASAGLAFYRAIFSAIGSFVAGVWRSIVAGATSAWNGVRAAVSAVTSWIRSTLASIGSFVNGVWNGIASAGRAAFNALRGVATSVLNAIMVPIRAIERAFNAVVGAIQSVIGWISKIKIPSLGAIGKVIGLNAVAPAPTAFGAGTPGPEARGFFDAPIVPRAAPSAGTYGNGVTININGGLDSADTIARRLEQILSDRARRTGGVRIVRRAA